MRGLKNFYLLLAMACLISLSGCVDLKQEIWLNPDGSGKMKINAVMVSQPDFFKIADKQKKMTVHSQTRLAIYNELTKSKGFSTWKDVSYKLREDGMIEFNAVGYFDNFAGVKMHLQNFSEDFNKMNLSFEGKKMIIRLEQKGKKEGSMFLPAGDSKYTPPESLAETILQQRVAYQQIKPLIRSAMEGMRQDITFNLPCQHIVATNFRVLGPGKAAITVSGKELIRVIEENLFDDKKAEKLLKGPKGEFLTEPPIEKINQELFGKYGLIEMSCDKATKALFDYKKEVANLPKTIDPILKVLKIDPSEFPATDTAHQAKTIAPGPVASGKALKSVKIGGIRQNFFLEDPVTQLRPFDMMHGIGLAVLVEFGGVVLKTDKGTLKKAISTDGEDLLGESEWDREFWSPRLNEKKDSAHFEINLKTPKNPKAGIQEISGIVRYSISKGLIEEKLGKIKVEPGFKGKVRGLMIEKVEPGYSSDTAQQMTIHLDVNYDEVQSIEFTGEDGKVLVAKQVSWSGGGEKSTFAYEHDKSWPKTVTAVLKMYSKLSSVESPFTLKDIKLLSP